MSMTFGCGAFDYDLIVIGGGAGGLAAALLSAKKGYKTAIFERKQLGGGRLWSGDIPFKVLFKKAKIFYYFNNIEKFGIFNSDMLPTGLINFQDYKFDRIMNHVFDIQLEILETIKQKITINPNIDVHFGAPRFINNHTLSMEGKIFTATNIIIATGARPKIPHIKGIDSIEYLTRDNFFALKSLPKSILIVGGGPLGTEMASALNRLGVDVTLIMKYGMLMPTYDYELVEMLTLNLLEEGVKIYCDTTAKEIELTDDASISLIAQDRAGGFRRFKAESLFVAIGSVPNVEGLDLEFAGVSYDNFGINISPTMQTNVPNIYACGDVAGMKILSRIAYFHAKIAIANMYKKPHDKDILADYTHVSKVIFTEPQIASAGMPEQLARKKYGDTLRIYRADYKDTEKAHIDHALIGRAKFICDQNGILLGAHIFGEQAGDLLDLVTIGKPFNEFFNNEAAKVRTSPSYVDILLEASHECNNDIEQVIAMQPSLASSCINTLFSWMGISRG